MAALGPVLAYFAGKGGDAFGAFLGRARLRLGAAGFLQVVDNVFGRCEGFLHKGLDLGSLGHVCNVGGARGSLAVWALYLCMTVILAVSSAPVPFSWCGAGTCDVSDTGTR